MEGVNVIEVAHRLTAKRVYVAFLAGIIAVISVAALTHRAYADTNDLTLLVSSSELRNQQEITLAIANDQVQESKVEIISKNDDTLGNPIEQLGQANETIVTLHWDTRTVPDGLYEIRYSAKFTGTWTNGESREVSVANNWPLVTLNPAADGRTISGFVSRRDVTFRILSGDKVIDNPPVRIADAAEPNGMVEWSSVLPANAGGGERTIEVFTTMVGGSRESVGAKQVMTLAASTPPKAPVEELIVSKPLPTIDFAPEIGQFIAPLLSDVGEVKLFGVPVSDLAVKQPAQQQSALPSILRETESDDTPASTAKSINVDEVKAPLQATDKGWHVFGIAWYWLLAGSAIVGSVALLRRGIN